MNGRTRAFELWRVSKQFYINLNFFPSVPLSTDEHELKNQRISTRVFILLFILSIAILLLYTSLTHVTKTISIDTPSLTEYLQLYSEHSQTPTCLCKSISISYETFLHIEYTFHQVCNSIFITDRWISHNDVILQYLFDSDDSRIFISYAFQGIRDFCQLIDKTIYNSLIQFNSSQYITASVISEQLFKLQTQSFINQFIFSTTNNFLLSFSMIRKTLQRNALISGRQTNYKLHTSDGDFLRTNSRYYSDCNCALSSTCVDNSSLFNGPSNIRVFNITGFYAGCYMIEALLRSNLQCFYNQTCIDGIKLYSLTTSQRDVPLLDSFLPSKYYQNSSIEDLLQNLMIEEWNSAQLYDQYYNECQPIQCTYTIKTKNNIIYIITTSIGIIGGLTKVSKILIPTIVKLIVYCLRKYRNRIVPQLSTIQN